MVLSELRSASCFHCEYERRGTRQQARHPTCQMWTPGYRPKGTCQVLFGRMATSGTSHPVSSAPVGPSPVAEVFTLGIRGHLAQTAQAPSRARGSGFGPCFKRVSRCSCCFCEILFTEVFVGAVPGSLEPLAAIGVLLQGIKRAPVEGTVLSVGSEITHIRHMASMGRRSASQYVV